MGTLLPLLSLLLATAATPVASDDLQVTVGDDGVTAIVLHLGAPPTFTTSPEPERFVVDLLEVSGEEARLAPDAPGVRAVTTSPTPKGLRLVVDLDAGAEPTVEVDGAVLSIRVEAPGQTRRSSPAEAVDAMDAAMEGLAAQVARIGNELGRLAESDGEAADDSAESPEEAPAAVADASAESPEETPAAVADASAESPEEEPVAVADAFAESSVEEPVVAAIVAELTHLGFRPTHEGAEVVVRLDGSVTPRLEEGTGELVLVLPHTKVRRANDRRPFDATFFDTPVGKIRPSVGRQGVRIAIELRREAVAKVVEKTGEIVVELLSR